MSVIHIQSGKNTVESNLEAVVQSMPFKIHADCDAKISKYFTPYIKTADDTLTASFRGFPLKGKVQKLPEGYKGVVLHESIRPMTEKEDRKVYIVQTYNRLTLWNWDKAPSKNDAFQQAFEWIDIAEALHSPIIEE